MPGGGSEARLFAANGPRGPLVVKVWPAAERARRQARQQGQVARGLGTGRFRAPGVAFFDEELRALGMARAGGRDLAALWADGATGVPDAAGGWLAAFHALSRRETRFAPAGQVNWLARLSADCQGGTRRIADRRGFLSAAARVSTGAEALEGRPAVRAVTHRDMTLSNLVLDPDGVVWGLDFENRREGTPLRDLFTLALDFLTLRGANGTEAVAGLIRAYGETGIDPAVRIFQQRCFCLQVWANTPPAPSARQRQRLKVAKRLLRTADPIL